MTEWCQACCDREATRIYIELVSYKGKEYPIKLWVCQKCPINHGYIRVAAERMLKHQLKIKQRV